MLHNTYKFINSTLSAGRSTLVNVTRPMSTRSSFLFKGNVKQYAPDDQKGIHSTRVEFSCDESDCKTKTCDKPCGPVIEAEPVGHFSHKPPAHKQQDSVLVHNKDFQGNKKDQYYIKKGAVNSSTWKAEDLKNLTEDDLQPQPNVDNYCKVHNITNIIDK